MGKLNTRKLYLSALMVGAGAGIAGFLANTAVVFHDTVQYRNLPAPLRSAIAKLEHPNTHLIIGRSAEDPLLTKEETDSALEAIPQEQRFHIADFLRDYRSPITPARVSNDLESLQDHDTAAAAFLRQFFAAESRYWGPYWYHSRPWLVALLGLGAFLPLAGIFWARRYLLWLHDIR